jgi:O-antigen ligase
MTAISRNPRFWTAGGFIATFAAATATLRSPVDWIVGALLFAIPVGTWLARSANAWLALFFAVALLSPPLPIAFGNSGPHPALLVAAIGVIIGVARLSDWRFDRALLSGSIVAFFAILTISVAAAAIYSGTDLAIESLARVAIAALSAYVFFYVSAGPGRKSTVSLTLLFWIAVASAAFAVVDFYFQLPAPAGFGPQFIWLDSGVFRRAQGLFYEASTLGNFCSFFVLMIAVALVQRVKMGALARTAMLAGGAVLLIALILSYSRSCLVAVGIALAALFFLERHTVSWKRVAIVTALAGASVIAILVQFLPEYANLYWTRLSGSLDLALDSNARVLSGRVESWQTLLTFLAEHPWHALIGVGYKTLPYSSFTGEPIVADNMYLSLLIETGVLGFAALLLLNFAIVRAGYRAARSGDRTRSFYGAWIFCFWIAQSVQMLSADLLTFWRVLPVYFWVLAMAIRK